MSSHQMNSVEEFCQEVVILNKGKTILNGNLNEIKDSYKVNKIEIDTKSDINLFASIFPISAPFCMPLRILVGSAKLPEIISSVAILCISILIIAKVSIKIYSDAILNYGTKMSLKNIFKIYKSKN